MDDAFTSKMETQAACKQLEEAHKAAHCRLVLQVEHYVGMVSAMEELMDKAEQSCSSMQAAPPSLRLFSSYFHARFPFLLPPWLTPLSPRLFSVLALRTRPPCSFIPPPPPLFPRPS